MPPVSCTVHTTVDSPVLPHPPHTFIPVRPDRGHLKPRDLALPFPAVKCAEREDYRISLAKHGAGTEPFPDELCAYITGNQRAEIRRARIVTMFQHLDKGCSITRECCACIPGIRTGTEQPPSLIGNNLT